MTPLELLPSVAETLGDRTEVYLDGGVRSGADVAAAVALAHAGRSWRGRTSTR